MRSNMHPMVKMNHVCKLVVCLWRFYMGPVKRKEDQVFGGIAVVKALPSVEALKQTLEMFTRKDQCEAWSL